MQIIDDICIVDTSFCFGCGLCVTSCSTGALSLKQKNSEELVPPPFSEKEWREKREKTLIR
ncbi:MAG: 4Fe-4S binding protein [Bacteroidetes bacterium]|nr:4Fe-4S binding protein [Bacteroidota bacterium]